MWCAMDKYLREGAGAAETSPDLWTAVLAAEARRLQGSRSVTSETTVSSA